MNDYEKDLPTTPERDRSELNIENIRQRGGMFVEAVRLTRMPMLIMDATLPGNPVIFINRAFEQLCGTAWLPSIQGHFAKNRCISGPEYPY